MPKPCPVCGLVTDQDPCARCGHVAGDILEETAAIIDGAMLVDEIERFLAFGPIDESITEIRQTYDEQGPSAKFSLEAIRVLHNYMRSRGRAKPLDEDLFL